MGEREYIFVRIPVLLLITILATQDNCQRPVVLFYLPIGLSVECSDEQASIFEQ